jgi:hypothetical protein
MLELIYVKRKIEVDLSSKNHKTRSFLKPEMQIYVTSITFWLGYFSRFISVLSVAKFTCSREDAQ